MADDVVTGPATSEDVLTVETDDVAAEIRELRGYRQRTAEISFGGDYDGMKVKVWVNAPRKLIRELGSNDTKASDKAFCAFVVSHNFTWKDGTKLPLPLTPASLDALDNVLITKIIKLGVEAIQQAAGINPT